MSFSSVVITVNKALSLLLFVSCSYRCGVLLTHSPYWLYDFPYSRLYDCPLPPSHLKPSLWMDFFAYTIKKRFLEYDWSANVSFFNNPSANLPEDLQIAFGVAFLFGIFHIFVRRYIFRKVLATIMFGGKVDPGPSLLHKFETACWKFLAYGSLTAYGIYALHDQSWVWKPEEYLINWKTHEFTPRLRFYYILCMGFYIFSTIAIFFEPKMKDFYQMFFHHIVTMMLVACSYALGYFRIGVIVMILHDCSDPLMEIAKVFHYVKNEMFANIFFVTFAGVFYYTRVYLYPLNVVQISMFVTLESRVKYPYGIECVGFLLCLQALHIFWSSLIAKMIIEAVIGGGVQGDTREEKDD